MLMDALRRSLTTMNITKNHETLHLFVVNWTEWHQLWPVQFANKNCDYANNKNGWNDYWKGIFSPQFANVHVQCSRKMIIMMMYMRNRYTFSSTRVYATSTFHKFYVYIDVCCGDRSHNCGIHLICHMATGQMGNNHKMAVVPFTQQPSSAANDSLLSLASRTTRHMQAQKHASTKIMIIHKINRIRFCGHRWIWINQFKSVYSTRSVHPKRMQLRILLIKSKIIENSVLN